MLKIGDTKLYVGTIADQNDDGTLEIQIPGMLPARDGEEDIETVDGIGYVCGPAARGGYRVGQKVLVLYFAEQIAPADKFVVLGVIENLSHHADATADRSVFSSPDGTAKLLLDNAEAGGTPAAELEADAIRIGAGATKGAARVDDLVKLLNGIVLTGTIAGTNPIVPGPVTLTLTLEVPAAGRVQAGSTKTKVE